MRIVRRFFKMEVPKTDIQKAIAYLNDACKLYDALPMQSMKSRAHMIRRLADKLKLKITDDGRNN